MSCVCIILVNSPEVEPASTTPNTTEGKILVLLIALSLMLSSPQTLMITRQSLFMQFCHRLY